MERDSVRSVRGLLRQAFAEEPFIQALGLSRQETEQLGELVNWRRELEELLPLSRRLRCAEVLALCRPMLDAVTPEPDGGWLACAYRTVTALLFPETGVGPAGTERRGALLFLRVLQILLDEEREEFPFDPAYDFDFCREDELKDSYCAEEYRRFRAYFRAEYIYELLRLGGEVTPFRSLEHIAGVHHVAMTVARAFAASGGHVDLALMSGAAAAHDLGKFGCRTGERVPYLHYYYTDRWCTCQGLPAIGHIAANHSVWDLELENLSSESLLLVYADFRVKQEMDPSGRELCHIYSLAESFEVILHKLDNVDAAKARRYRFVYAKLRDFEAYLRSFGVDVELNGRSTSRPAETDPALLAPEQVVEALRLAAVDHNIRLMHRLSHDQLFTNVLESARGERDAGRLRAYVAVFEEYFAYLTSAQKEQTLSFLYELLMDRDGDIRRQAAALIGRILATFCTGYKKELPADVAQDPEEDRPYVLWSEYLERILRPDRRLTPRQISLIRYTAKLVLESLLEHCTAAEGERFTAELLRHYDNPAHVDGDTAFALLDAVVSLPADHCPPAAAEKLTSFAAWWLRRGTPPQQAAALRLFRQLLLIPELSPALRQTMAAEVAELNCGASTPLLFLRTQLARRLGLDAAGDEARLRSGSAVSGVLLDNLRSSTHWVLKTAGVEYLQDQASRGASPYPLAAHFSNLVKVGENAVIRRMARASLLEIAPYLAPDQRNEIAVELSRSLDASQSRLYRDIPLCLGCFSLWLDPRELDEIVERLQALLDSADNSVASAALTAAGAMLEAYGVYAARFPEAEAVGPARRRRLAGMLLRGLASYREPLRQTALRVLGDGIFASSVLSMAEKDALFTLTARKALCLLRENEDRGLTFFYTAGALSHLYRFIVRHCIDEGAFRFTVPDKVAFFPGTFDPFSLSHRGIVRAIRDRGFEVYLAVDEFSWSKKTQPSLIRRQIVSISTADEFDVYLFPGDLPINLANAQDLDQLRALFKGRELYLAVGSDVIAGASSYKAAPTPGSVHFLNHIVFRRHDAGGDSDLSAVQGKVLVLQLPPQLEDVSSTRIRENIDLGRDISNLVDPAVQDYLYRNSLYLREPQYKRLMRAGDLDFRRVAAPDEALTARLAALGIAPARGDALTLLLDRSRDGRILGVLFERTVDSADLFAALGSAAEADRVRRLASGRILLITGLKVLQSAGLRFDAAQLLLTEALFHALKDACSYAVCRTGKGARAVPGDLPERSGFVRVPGSGELMITDMRAPVALIQNIPTTLKEPFASDANVLGAVLQAHARFQRAVAALYPGTLVLSLNAEVIYHRLVRRITALNGVPDEPTRPRVLGPLMCVPFGKILRGNVIPNTVTKTIHTDKVFTPDLRSFTIGPYPGYAPLASQVRTVRSFRRSVILVDDLLHSGNRMRVLDPLLRQHGVEVDRVLVGLLSGRGRDLMASRGRTAESVYFIPNLRAWFVESTLYPFIGGDNVSEARSTVPGLSPAINLILPYAFPRFFRECDRDASFGFSRTCLENSRDILRALERAYRERYTRNLTLPRLGEAVILPLAPDRGGALRYEADLPASACLESDLQLLERMQNLLA